MDDEQTPSDGQQPSQPGDGAPTGGPADNHHHGTARSNQLRAAVLGANDGIVSTAALVLGVAAASSTRTPIVVAAVAGVIAGASSMAVGEYVSVSAARDAQQADLRMERAQHAADPAAELEELTDNFVARGVRHTTARQVAVELTEANALEAHAREELGITRQLAARPWSAALLSAVMFLVGGLVPVVALLLAPSGGVIVTVALATLVALALVGVSSASAGHAHRPRAVTRIMVGGTLAMLVTAVIGTLFDVSP